MATKHRGPKGASWTAQAFESKTAKAGGVVRRGVATAKKANGYHDLIDMVHARGYRALIGGGQIAIFCNADPVTYATTGHPI